MWFFDIQTATIPTHTGRTGRRCTTSKPKKWSRGWQNLELKHQQPCCPPGSQGRRRSPTFTPDWEGFPQLWLFLVVMSTFHLQSVIFHHVITLCFPSRYSRYSYWWVEDSLIAGADGWFQWCTSETTASSQSFCEYIFSCSYLLRSKCFAHKKNGLLFQSKPTRTLQLLMFW